LDKRETTYPIPVGEPNSNRGKEGAPLRLQSRGAKSWCLKENQGGTADRGKGSSAKLEMFVKFIWGEEGKEYSNTSVLILQTQWGKNIKE